MTVSRCPTDPTGMNECREAVRTTLSFQAGEVVDVSTVIPPLSGFTSPRGYTCPHGMTYWVTLPGGDGGRP